MAYQPRLFSGIGRSDALTEKGAADLQGCECLDRIRHRGQGTFLVSRAYRVGPRSVCDGRRERAGRACRGGAVAQARRPRRPDRRTGESASIGQCSSGGTGRRARRPRRRDRARRHESAGGRATPASTTACSDRQCRTPRCTGCCPRRTRRGAHSREVRQRVRRHVWTLLHLRPGGFPYLTVAGRHLKGWIVLDMDATVITAASRKTGRRRHVQGHLRLPPIGRMAGQHRRVPGDGTEGRQRRREHRRRSPRVLRCRTRADTLLLPGQDPGRVDGAGATHGLLEHLQALNTTRRTVRYTVGWTITPEDERPSPASPKPPGKPPCDRTARSKRATSSPS